MLALRGRSLAGLNAIVTGASSGLGMETARVLANAGALVVMACRSVEAGQQIASGLTGQAEVDALDLSDLGSVRAFAPLRIARHREVRGHVNDLAEPRACEDDARIGDELLPRALVVDQRLDVVVDRAQPSLALPSSDRPVVDPFSTQHAAITKSPRWSKPITVFETR